MLIRIKQSSVVVLSLFLKEVLIRFIAEKERSHSAVLTGMIAATTNWVLTTSAEIRNIRIYSLSKAPSSSLPGWQFSNGRKRLSVSFSARFYLFAIQISKLACSWLSDWMSQLFCELSWCCRGTMLSGIPSNVSSLFAWVGVVQLGLLLPYDNSLNLLVTHSYLLIYALCRHRCWQKYASILRFLALERVQDRR